MTTSSSWAIPPPTRPTRRRLHWRACQRGLSVGFVTVAHLVRQLTEALHERRLLRLQTQLTPLMLLIIDGLGRMPLLQTGRNCCSMFSARGTNAARRLSHPPLSYPGPVDNSNGLPVGRTGLLLRLPDERHLGPGRQVRAGLALPGAGLTILSQTGPLGLSADDVRAASG